MTDTERLAEMVEFALRGGAWHGPSWREVLEGVPRPLAVTRPIPAAHSIADIVLHAITWQDVVRRRLLGECPPVSAEEDWPDPDVPDDAAWEALKARLLTSGDALKKGIAAFPESRLHERRPGLGDTWYGLIIGELQHMLYHAGQVAVLRKAT